MLHFQATEHANQLILEEEQEKLKAERKKAKKKVCMIFRSFAILLKV